MSQPENLTLQATLENEEVRRAARKGSAASRFFATLGRIAILLALIASPWMYGGVLTWGKMWLAIATLFGLGFWWFETALARKNKQVFPYLFFLLLAGAAIGGLQFVNLPSSLSFLAGNQPELYRTYSVAGSELGVEPAGEESPVPQLEMPLVLSLDREATIGQVALLWIAMGGLLLGCRLFRDKQDMVLLLAALTVNGVAVAFFGLIQKLSAPPRTVYWMELSQGGIPFGPFVNRNNAAGYLLLCLAAAIGLILTVIGDRKDKGPVPMVSKEMPPWRQLYFHLLFFVSELTATKIACLISSVVIGAGVIATLSRGGVLAMGVGGIGTLLAYGMARRPQHSGFIVIPLVALVVGLTSWLGFSDQLISRFEKTDVTLEEIDSSDKRFQTWRDTFPATREMGIFGAGLGSYAKVHRIYRSDYEHAVFEYAENQFFQAVVEAGWLGVVLFLAAWILTWQYASKLLHRGQSATTVACGTAGVFLVMSQATAALFDFGMYIPSNMLTMAVMVGFVAYHAHALAGRLRKSSWLQYQFPNVWVQLLLLLVFAGLTLSIFDLSRRARIDQVCESNVRRAGVEELDLESTEQQINQLQNLSGISVSTNGLNQLGDLWVHRCRLELFEGLKDSPAFQQVQEEFPEDYSKRVWSRTRLSVMHELIHSLRRESEVLAARFVDQDFIPYNLGRALKYYAMSRSLSPLQPRVHMQLGRIHSIYGRYNIARVDLKRAVELAPGNWDIRVAAGMLWLQEGEKELACEQLRRALELQPKSFLRTMNTVMGWSTHQLVPLTEREIFESLLPEDPGLLYQFAVRFVKNDERLKKQVLQRANELLGEVSRARKDQLLLSANINLQLEDMELGIQLLNDVLTSYPADEKVRLRLAKILLNEGMLEEAGEHIARLLRNNRRNKDIQNLFEKYELLRREAEESDE